MSPPWQDALAYEYPALPEQAQTRRSRRWASQAASRTQPPFVPMPAGTLSAQIAKYCITLSPFRSDRGLAADPDKLLDFYTYLHIGGPVCPGSRRNWTLCAPRVVITTQRNRLPPSRSMAPTSAASKPPKPHEDGPVGSMRLRSCRGYPDLCDLKYALHQHGSGRGAEKRLSIALAIGISLPTRAGMYDFGVFCDHNRLARVGAKLALHLQVTYGTSVFSVSDGRSWQNMLERIDLLLRPKRASGKPFTPLVLEIRPIGARGDTAGEGTYTSPHEFKSWIAYSGQVGRKHPDGLGSTGGEDEDDEWAACCEFMLHPYEDRGPDVKKMLLGVQSAITPSEMLGAYRLLSRVAQGEGGTTVQTIGHPGTLRTQMATTAILRQIVLCKRHFVKHPHLHQRVDGAAPGQTAAFGCNAGDPLGIQCVCRPGTMAARLAARLGDTDRPFVYLLKRRTIIRCHEEMKAFFSDRLSAPWKCRFLQPVCCRDVRALAVPPPDGAAPIDDALIRYILSGNAGLVRRKHHKAIDRGEFVVLIDAAEAAEVLAPPGSTAPDEGNWLWQECRPLCISVPDWRPPFLSDTEGGRAATALIRWAVKMKSSLPQEAGIVSITTPGVIGQEDLDVAALLCAAAPTMEEARQRIEHLGASPRGATGEAGLLRRYGIVQPCEPDFAARIKPYDGPGTRTETPAAMTVTVDYVLLRPRDGSDHLCPETLSPQLAARVEPFMTRLFQTAKAAASRPTANLLSALTTAEARIANVLELFSFTPDTCHEAEALFTTGSGELDCPLLPTIIVQGSPSVQTLIEVISRHADGTGAILVLVNDEALTISIARYLNATPKAWAEAVVALTPDWVSVGEEATTTLEAEVKLLATSDSSKTVVLVAGPEAMDSAWLPLGYVHCCVVFGAPFSPLPVRSAIQAVCGSGEPRDVRIVYIGPAGEPGEPGQSLNGVMRAACMEADTIDPEING